MKKKPDDHVTALVNAACEGQEAIVRQYIEKNTHKLASGRDVTDKAGISPLMHAAFFGRNHIIQLLLDNGACIEQTSSSKQTVLMFAAMGGEHETIVFLLEKKGVAIQALDAHQWSAFTYAINNGYTDAARVLVQHGAYLPMDASNHEMWCAAKEGKINAIRILLEIGVYLDPMDRFYACMDAIEHGHIDIAQLLLHQGDIDLNARDERDKTLLVYAIEQREIEAVYLLLEVGADVNAVGGESGTALSCAAQHGYKAIATVLLDAGAHINVEHERVTPPMACAAYSGHLSMVEYFLQHGGLINAVNYSGKTALILAVIKQHREVVVLLMQWHADITLADSAGKTALDYARAASDEKIVSLLTVKAEPVSQEKKRGPECLTAECGIFAHAEKRHCHPVTSMTDGMQPVS